MWWGAAGNGYHMPFGMFMMPMFFLILAVIAIYFFNRNNRSHDGHRSSYYENKDEVLKEIQELKKEIRELKKEKEKE